jgi:putative polyketide hydroxylase
MTPVDVPVIIVGAGPAGLCAGLFLARHGIRPLVLERHPGTSVHPRARGLGARTMELLRELGIEEAVRQAGQDLAGSGGWVSGPSLASMDLTQAERLREFGGRLGYTDIRDYTPSPGILCPQHLLEPHLLTAAVDAGVDVRFGTAVTGLAQAGDHVSVTIRDAQGRAGTVRAPYLIGADGQRSTVRTHCGIAMTSHRFHRRFVSIYFRTDLGDLVNGHRFIGCQITTKGAEGALFGVDNRRHWVFLKPVSQGEVSADYSDARCRALVAAVAGRPTPDLEILSALEWKLMSGIAEEFSRGRVFLAGDAAHVMPISGGFGANTGMHDAHNLAWKLAASLHGYAGPGLLASYQRERRAIASFTMHQAVLRSSHTQLRWGSTDTAAQRRGEVGMVDAAVIDVGYSYAHGRPVPPASGPHRLVSGVPGTRAPHCWVIHEGRRKSTLDLFGRGFVLLTTAPGRGQVATAATAAASLGAPLTAYRVGPGLDLHDPDGNWRAAALAGQDEAMLIRPDGFVAWRGTAPDAQLLREKLDKALTDALAGRQMATDSR